MSYESPRPQDPDPAPSNGSKDVILIRISRKLLLIVGAVTAVVALTIGLGFVFLRESDPSLRETAQAMVDRSNQTTDVNELLGYFEPVCGELVKGFATAFKDADQPKSTAQLVSVEENGDTGTVRTVVDGRTEDNTWSKIDGQWKLTCGNMFDKDTATTSATSSAQVPSGPSLRDTAQQALDAAAATKDSGAVIPYIEEACREAVRGLLALGSGDDAWTETTIVSVDERGDTGTVVTAESSGESKSQEWRKSNGQWLVTCASLFSVGETTTSPSATAPSSSVPVTTPSTTRPVTTTSSAPTPESTEGASGVPCTWSRSGTVMDSDSGPLVCVYVEGMESGRWESRPFASGRHTEGSSCDYASLGTTTLGRENNLSLYCHPDKTWHYFPSG